MVWSRVSRRQIEAACAASSYRGDQAFSRTIGHIDIRCSYKAELSKWTVAPENAHISGILYFNLEYKELGSVSLRSATIEVDVWKGVNSAPLPVFACHAPSSAIIGMPLKQHVLKSTILDPQVELTAPYGGFSGSGYSHGTSIEYDEEHTWSFKAGNPSGEYDIRITKADFTWMRTLPREHAGIERVYTGALVLYREKNAPVQLRISVKARPWKRNHSIRFAGCKRMTSHPIGPSTGVSIKPSDFAVLQSKLQHEVLSCNLQMAANQVHDVNVVTAVVSEGADIPVPQGLKALEAADVALDTASKERDRVLVRKPAYHIING